MKASTILLFSKFSFAILFMLFTLFLWFFLYSLIYLPLWNFKTVFLNRSLMRISFRISLLNHDLSLFRIIIIFVGIHSCAIFRKHFVNFFAHFINVIQVVKFFIPVNFLSFFFKLFVINCLILPNFSFKWSWDIFGTLKNYDWGIMITNIIIWKTSENT
jgi:hypothetical protein